MRRVRRNCGSCPGSLCLAQWQEGLPQRRVTAVMEPGRRSPKSRNSSRSLDLWVTKVKKKKKSVLKRAAQSRQRAEVNRANRTRVRTLMRRLRTAITAGDPTAAGNLLHPTMSAIDQAIAKGMLHENTANRYKSRL